MGENQSKKAFLTGFWRSAQIFFRRGVSICFDNLEPKADSIEGRLRKRVTFVVARAWRAVEPDMHQGMPLGTMPRTEGATGGVTQFAAEVVARLVQRDAVEDTGLRDVLVERLLLAVTATGSEGLEQLKPELRRARVSAASLADLYIPEVARRLGRAWETDCLSFASVTMGVARLQAILREIGTGWSADRQGAADGPTLLLILPQGEQHTLGAMVLAGKLRRMGISVSMRIAPVVTELGHFVAERAFDGALVSIACNDRLETCGKLVKTLKESSRGELRVVVGGAILGANDDVKRATGADLVTNDIFDALDFMGLVVGRMAEMEPS